MATLNGYKTSGTFSATTTYQTIYTLAPNVRGFTTAIGSGSSIGAFTAFFDAYSGGSYPSLTAVAMSGNSGMSSGIQAPNTLGAGTQTVFLQGSAGTSFNIQVKVLSACTITWYITFL